MVLPSYCGRALQQFSDMVAADLSAFVYHLRAMGLRSRPSSTKARCIVCSSRTSCRARPSSVTWRSGLDLPASLPDRQCGSYHFRRGLLGRSPYQFQLLLIPLVPGYGLQSAVDKCYMPRADTKFLSGCSCAKGPPSIVALVRSKRSTSAPASSRLVDHHSSRDVDLRLLRPEHRSST